MIYFPSVVLLGGVFEWFKDPVLKTGDFVRGPWVRIPPPPPLFEVRCSKLDVRENGFQV